MQLRAICHCHRSPVLSRGLGCCSGFEEGGGFTRPTNFQSVMNRLWEDKRAVRPLLFTVLPPSVLSNGDNGMGSAILRCFLSDHPARGFVDRGNFFERISYQDEREEKEH